MELGQKLREARLHAGLKQEELAKRLGVSRQTVSNWENGQSLPDVVGDAKMKLTVTGLSQETLTLYEEYHCGSLVETAAYTLEPAKPCRYEMELTTRYDGKEEWALYRIPFEDGEYRFVLVFG